jgi:RNA polymerase sigma-70 factor (ECF subfamily)
MESVFAARAEQHRRELHVHCYRMLGSFDEAEDLVQETLLRAWRRRDTLERDEWFRAWLYKIATNACLDHIKAKGRRLATLESFKDLPWLQPYPDRLLDEEIIARETIELTFLAVIQLLPPRQRAVLIMRDVLGFSAREAAELLENTVASVNSALQRARKTVEERLPERSQQETLRLQGDERMRALVDAYVDAWQRGDVAAVAALLAEDATFSMPPWPIWWRGRHAIAGFAATAAQVCPDVRTVRTSANGQLALAYYSLEAATGRYVASAIDVFTFDAGLIKDITAFVTPAMFPSFDLPAEYPVRAHAGS